MAWKRVDGTNFIRFQDGGVIEGTLVGVAFRKSPFNTEQELIDITINCSEGEKILSSSSENLKRVFIDMPADTSVRIEMLVKGGKKLYNVYTNVD
jgi:hypothetical protein